MAQITPSWFLSIPPGFVRIPLKSYPAARDERIEFRRLHEPCATKGLPATVEQHWICTACRSDAGAAIVKGYELGKDQYVLVTQQELDSVEPESSKTMEVRGFVSFEKIDIVYLGKSNYLGPADQVSAKAFRLFHEMLRHSRQAALVQYVERAKEKIGVIRALPSSHALMLHECFYASEVRTFESQERIEIGPIKLEKKDLDTAKKLVEHLSLETFDPTAFTDGYRERVTRMLELKIAGQPIPRVEAKPTPIAMGPDLADALRRSIAAIQQRMKVQEKGKVKSKKIERKRA